MSSKVNFLKHTVLSARTVGLFSIKPDPFSRGLYSSSCLCQKKLSNLKGKKVGSQRWLLRQHKDPYVKRAREESYRCRSAFKLLEIDDKHHILQPGHVVVDCGAAPGSWTQVALERVEVLDHIDSKTSDDSAIYKGYVIAVDLQPMAPIKGATILQQRDFRDASTQREISSMLFGRKVNVVLSDMAPNASGIKSLDHDNVVDLCLSALKFSAVVLEEGGTFLCKLWQGKRQEQLQRLMQQVFTNVNVIKPHASRSDSAEIYLMGTRFTGPPPRTPQQSGDEKK